MKTDRTQILEAYEDLGFALHYLNEVETVFEDERQRNIHAEDVIVHLHHGINNKHQAVTLAEMNQEN